MLGSAPTRIRTLTPEQTAALAVYRSRWAAIRRSTAPADRSAAEEAVRLAYRAAGLKPPGRLVWCESPIALWQAAGRAAHVDGRNVRSAIIDRLRRRVAREVGKRLHRDAQTAVERVVNPPDALVETAANVVMQRLPQEHTSLVDYLRRSGPLSLSGAVRALLGRDGIRYSIAGPRELSWLGPCEYLRDVLGLRAETEALDGLIRLAGSAGWLQPHEHVCWLGERPDLLCSDARDRLHHASGPALRFPDGFSAWAWRGVEVPRWIIEQPAAITLASIDGETDVQIRRCMIEIMTPQRYVALGGAVPVAEDEAGILWRRAWLASDAWAAVEVINATPEPDGTRRHFFLQVPANLKTARDAVAWTYGMRADAYARLVMRT